MFHKLQGCSKSIICECVRSNQVRHFIDFTKRYHFEKNYLIMILFEFETYAHVRCAVALHVYRRFSLEFNSEWFCLLFFSLSFSLSLCACVLRRVFGTHYRRKSRERKISNEHTEHQTKQTKNMSHISYLKSHSEIIMADWIID